QGSGSEGGASSSSQEGRGPNAAVLSPLTGSTDAPERPADKEGCDDAGGPEPSCSVLETGACGAAFERLCRPLRRVLKTRVARAGIDCLDEKTRASSCLEFDECLQRGLELACPTDADRSSCREVLGRCNEPEPGQRSVWYQQQRCEQGLAALKLDERARVIACL